MAFTRNEHVAWAKQRALEYVDAGRPGEAISSMISDLEKHAETEQRVWLVGLAAPLSASSGGTVETWSAAVRTWIEEIE